MKSGGGMIRQVIVRCRSRSASLYTTNDHHPNFTTNHYIHVHTMDIGCASGNSI